MSDLSQRDRELVALGAAMGSNCVPCVEFHIPESRKAGLSDEEIHAAIQHADRIRQVPARKTLQAALKLLPTAAGEPGAAEAGAGCGAAAVTAVQTGMEVQRRDMMPGMMSHMMDMCGRRQSAAAPDSAQKQPAAAAATSTGCGCG